MRLRGLLLGVLVFTIALLVSGCGTQPSQSDSNGNDNNGKLEKSKLKIAYSAPSIGSLSLIFIGKEKGFFEKYGLDVEITSIQSSAILVPAIIAGEVNLGEGLGGAAAISAVLEGADLKIINAMLPVINASIVSQPGIKNYQELKGKKIGITRIGSAAWYAVRIAARGWGMDPDKDFTIIQAGGIGEIFGALQSGSVDAAVGFEHYVPQLKEMGYYELVDLSNVPFLHSSMVASSRFLKENPVTMENFFKAYLESIKFFRENKAEVLKIVAGAMKVSAETMPYLEKAYDKIVASDNMIAKIPYPTVESVQATLDELSTESARKAKPEQFIDDSYLRKLEDSGFVAQLYKQ